MKENILVLDVGTSSMRGILYAFDGKRLATEQLPYRATYLANGWVEQNVSDWENSMLQILRSISEKAESNGWKIDGIALTAQRSSVIAVDKEIRPLQPAIMWQDKRTAEICSRLEAENEMVFSHCGSRINPVFGGTKMAWIRENQPEIYRKTYKFLVIPDYLLWILTGELKTDYTYGSRSLLMNLWKKEWDDELLNLFGVEPGKLCELTEPGVVFGKLTGEAAKKTGLKRGIPVISAGGDQQCGAIGQGVYSEGHTSVTAGTGGFIITAVNGIPQHLVPDITCNCSSIRGQYILESGLLTCCSAFDWFCRNFYEGAGFDEINETLDKAPLGANSLVCLPFFQGRANPDWNNLARGLFSNITLNHEKSDFLRALVEGICYEFYNGIGIIGQYVKPEKITVDGGLSNSQVFDQILCDVLGKPLVCKETSDATACGALVVSMTALGVTSDAEGAYKMINKDTKEQIFYPDEEHAKKYQDYIHTMNKWYGEIYG